MRKIEQSCQESTGITQDLVYKMGADIDKYIKNPKVREFVNCMFTNAGYLDSSHKVSFNAVKNDLKLYYGEVTVQKTISSCDHHEQGKDSTDSSCEAVKCIFKMLNFYRQNKSLH